MSNTAAQIPIEFLCTGCLRIKRKVSRPLVLKWHLQRKKIIFTGVTLYWYRLNKTRGLEADVIRGEARSLEAIFDGFKLCSGKVEFYAK